MFLNKLRVFSLLTGAFLMPVSCSKPKEVPVSKLNEDGLPVIAEVLERSTIPDPAHSDYPDCLFSAALQVQGTGAATTVPEKIQVLLPGFTDRKLTPSAGLKAGDLIKLRIRPEKEVSKAQRAMQRADSLSDFTLPVYYATGFDPAIPSELAGAAQPAAPQPKPADGATAPVVNRYPWSAKAAACRKFAMDQDMALIRDAIVRHGGSIESWQKDLRSMTDDLSRQAWHATNHALLKGGHYFERLRADEYEAVCRQADKNEGPFKTLVAMHKLFRSHGIDLIVVPFPQKEEINAGVFCNQLPADGILEPWRMKFLLKLMESDVEVLDLAPALRAALPERENLFYPLHDSHPADGGLIVAAQAIAGRLERYDLLKRPGFVPRKYRFQTVGYATNNHQKDTPEREYTASQLIYADGSEVKEEDDDISTPVLMIGDSYTAVPKGYGAKNASLCYQLAPYLGELPDLINSMGGAPQMLKIIAQQGEELFKGRCVAVFVFSPNALLNPPPNMPWIVVDGATPKAK